MIPILLEPVYDKRLWGRNQIPTIRKEENEGVAASWQISAHPNFNNKILNGEYAGQDFLSVLEAHTEELLGKGRTMHDMLRVALSDSNTVLSIQNHPDDEYAHAHTNDNGKTESWYVISADPGTCLLAGCKCTSKQQVLQSIQNKTILYDMIYHPVKAGDFVHIQSGELHALGPNIMILEIANNSDVTYRLYDHDRLDKDGNPRELHLKDGIESMNLEARSENIHHPLTNKYLRDNLVTTDRYKVDLIDVQGEYTFKNNGSFSTIHCVNNEGIVEVDGKEYPIAFIQSMFMPATIDTFKVKGNCRIICGYPIEK